MTSIAIDSYIQENVPSSYRFSLAHELAHLLIHPDIIGQYEFDTLAEWKAVVTGLDEKVFADFEWQASELAGLMLVPQEALAAEFGKAAAKIRAAGMSLEKAKEAGRFSVEDNLRGDSWFLASSSPIGQIETASGLNGRLYITSVPLP